MCVSVCMVVNRLLKKIVKNDILFEKKNNCF